jgi:hypothetical protein
VAVGLTDEEGEREERVLPDGLSESVVVTEEVLVASIVLEAVPDTLTTVGVDDWHKVDVKVFPTDLLATWEEDPDREPEESPLGETVTVGVKVPSEDGESEVDTIEVDEMEGSGELEAVGKSDALLEGDPVLVRLNFESAVPVFRAVNVCERVKAAVSVVDRSEVRVYVLRTVEVTV